LRLGGRNHYAERVEDRPVLGYGRAAAPSDIARAVRLSRDVSTALVFGLGLTGAAMWSATR
jgi:adenosylcobinamide-phosphate synthase